MPPTKQQLDEIREKILKQRKEREQRLLDMYRTMKPFRGVDDIPEVPVVERRAYDDVIIPNLIRCGAIPKEQLEVGATYEGTCRNASKATWNGTRFDYERCKFGTTYTDHINHFQDDDGYDVFVPIRKIETDNATH